MTDAHTDNRPFIGIDLGGTNIQFGVVSASGEVLGRAKNKTLAREGRDAVLARIVTGAEDACREAGMTVAGHRGDRHRRPRPG